MPIGEYLMFQFFVISNEAEIKLKLDYEFKIIGENAWNPEK